MKILGIIGGFGPESTAKFYLEIIKICRLKNKIQRPPALIWSVPLKYKIENELIIQSKSGEKYLPYLIKAAKILEQGGADFIVMPCNTLHQFIENIRNSTTKPVLSIIDETVKKLKEKKIKRIGILATQSTLDKKLYTTALEKQNIKFCAPPPSLQKTLNKTIDNILTNKQTDKDSRNINEILGHFSNEKIHDVILACTDLQLLSPKHPKIKIHDTMKILADATVRELLK